MSTYYEYKDVKVMIAHKLMSMEGWKVYGYHADESDSMTDYYSPAYWNGVAEKNGYILCVNVYGAAKEQDITRYNKNYVSIDSKTKETIKKLEAMTQEHGASEQEEETAKAKIELLKNKVNENNTNISQYEVIGKIPAHQAHPPRCNWHIEKDGVIIEKGNGILKYSSIDNYYNYDSYMKDMNEFKTMSKENYIKKYMKDARYNHCSDEEKEMKYAESHYNDMLESKKLMDQFEAFINKIDTTCGGILGTGDLVTYEKVIVTEYKTENKAVEIATGSIKDGQCFILKTGFNYGRSKGYVYRIREMGEEGKKYFTAYKLNGKLTKECHGMANQSNTWYIGTEDRITKWIEKGSISWCNIQEVKTPYEVEKVVKKVIKAETTEQQATNEINALHYDIKEDIDTRDNSKIYVVKVFEKLDRDEYLTVNNNMKSIGGYYSKFKHGFIFKDDPTELLNNDTKQDTTEVKEEVKQEQKQAKQDKLIDKINNQIESIQKKIDGLSGDYKTNTYKRMNEQASRESKIEGFKNDIELLQYLLDTLEIRGLTPLEENLIISSFRVEIYSYYIRHNAYLERKGTALKEISFPEINKEYPDNWYNKEVPTKQKRLQKANIYNTFDLLKAVEEYKQIYNLINKPVNHTEKKIKQLEREYKMQQKGDINFTPTKVVKQMIEYAHIDENSRVLEPSAGIGNIADQIKQITKNIDVCEYMYHFSELLELKGYNVVGNDFLEYNTDQKYDSIIMNPPFSNEQEHIKHAYKLLKDDGILVTISSPHWTFANDKNSVEFREWLDNETYFTKDLKGGTFEMTGVASKIIVIEKHTQAESKTA